MKLKILPVVFILQFSSWQICIAGKESTEELCMIKDLTSGKKIPQIIDSNQSVCCHDRVISRYDKLGREIGCCSNTTYYVDEKICCQGKLYPFWDNGHVQICCGGRPSSEDKVCCSGQLYDYEGGKICCGKQYINGYKKKCCMDEVRKRYSIYPATRYKECCLSNLYDTRKQHCYYKTTILPIGHEICGNVTFDTRTHQCCGKTLHILTGDRQCCGENLFNVNSERCCNTDQLPHIAPLKYQCCGNGYFHSNTERCCSGKVMKAKPDQDCCGANLFNVITQGCCGTMAYDTNTSQCCQDGEIATIAPKQFQCCGSGYIDSSKEVCCRNRDSKNFSIRKTSPGQNSCCVHPSNKINVAILYDSSVESCYNGSVVPLKQAKPVCGTREFNSKKDVCCNGRVHVGVRRKGVKVKCCEPGQYVFYPKSQICCDSLVINKSQRKSCGSKHVISPSKQNLRSSLSDKTYGICSICRWRESDFMELLKDGTFSLFESNAVKLIISQVKQARYKRKNLRQTEIEAVIVRNIDDPKNKTMNGNQLTLQLPCSCKKRFQDRGDLLLLTHIPLSKSPMRLGDADLVMPFSARLQKVVKRTMRKFKLHRLRTYKNAIGNEIRHARKS